MLKRLSVKYIEKQLNHYQLQVINLEKELDNVECGSYREKELLKEYNRNFKLLQAYKVVYQNLKEEK